MDTLCIHSLCFLFTFHFFIKCSFLFPLLLWVPNLHTDLQTQQMVWKFGPKPCEQLLFLLRSKLNALIWQEFRNPNKSADPTKLQHVSHCEEVNGLFCCHRPAHTFKAKCASKLPKGNYSQSSLSLMLIPHFWNNILLSSWGVGPHADVTIPRLSSAQGVPRAIWLQTRIKGYTQDRAVTADKEALDGVDLTSKGFFALFWFFFSIWRA